MRITSATNDNIVITAKDASDFQKALSVAEKMVEQNSWMVLACEDPDELWVQVTALWRGKQAQDMRDAYNYAKKH